MAVLESWLAFNASGPARQLWHDLEKDVASPPFLFVGLLSKSKGVWTDAQDRAPLQFIVVYIFFSSLDNI